jgi:hypothetical protein
MALRGWPEESVHLTKWAGWAPLSEFATEIESGAPKVASVQPSAKPAEPMERMTEAARRLNEEKDFVIMPNI